MYKQLFDYRFYPHDLELFLALYGSYYSYEGSVCREKNTLSIDLTVLLRDQLAYPSGIVRNAFPAYDAATYLEKKAKYHSPWIYAVWKMKGKYRSTSPEESFPFDDNLPPLKEFRNTWEKIQ